MELTQLRYFRDVADTQHMTRSAGRLHVAQPALSQSIHRLEDEIGVKLFERDGRNIRLTSEGSYLHGQVSAMLDSLDTTVEDLRLSAAHATPVIRVGIFSASSIVVDVIAEFMAENPDVSFEVIQKEDEGRFDVAIRTLRHSIHTEKSKRKGGVAFAGIASEADPPTGSRKSVGGRQLLDASRFSEAIGAAVPSDYGFGEEICLTDLEHEHFISLAGSRSFRHLCDELCAQRGFFPNVTFDSDRLDIVKKMIGLGFGVGFWPEFSWGDVSSDALHWVRITDEGFRRTLAIELAGHANGAAEMFYEFLIGRLGDVFCQNGKRKISI